MIIGLTGGIGSGKSTIAQFFSDLNIEIIDADDVVKNLLTPPSLLLTHIAEKLGKDILLKDNQLNRPLLREKIFNDDRVRLWLNSQIHPKVRQEIMDFCQKSQSAYTIVVVPLMFETGFNTLIDRILTINISETLQRERSALRDKVSQQDIQKIMDTQWTNEQRITKADDIIDNNKTIEHIKKQVLQLNALYLSLCQKAH